MTTMLGTGFITAAIPAPPAVYRATETIIGRRMTAEEQRVLNTMFETTVSSYDMGACEPRVTEVKKWLKRIASEGEIPSNIVTAEMHLIQRHRSVAAGRDPNSVEVLKKVFATPMAGEAELLKAKELIEGELRCVGTALADASTAAIKDAASRAIVSLAPLIKRGRPRRDHGQVGSGMRCDNGLIWGWADLAEHLGIRASVAYDPIKGKRDTRFLRWLRMIASYMPARMQRTFIGGIEDRAKVALKLRRDSGIDSGLFG